MKKTIFQGKKFSIITEKNSQGKTIEYCQRPSSIIVLVVSKGDNVLLLREKRLERGGYTWGLVAGHIEKNEKNKPVVAAKRELTEEANLIAKKIKLFFVSEPSSSIKWKRYVYVVEEFLTSKIIVKKDADEKIEVHYVPFAKALKMAIGGQIRNETAALAIIKYISQKKTLTIK